MKIEVYESQNQFLTGYLLVINDSSFFLVDSDEIGSHYFVSIPDQLNIILEWFITISSKKIQLESLMTHPDREIRRFAANLVFNKEEFIQSIYLKFQKARSLT